MLIKHLFALFTVVFLLSEVLFIEASGSHAPTMPSKGRTRKNKRKDLNKSYYENNKEDILSDRKEKYDADKRSKRHSQDYYRDIKASQTKSVESSKVHY